MSLDQFKGGARWLTKALFLEESYEDKSRVLYTLKEDDHRLPDGRLLPSLKKLYLQEADVTEYNFATKYLGGWEHWQELCNSSIRPHIDKWRFELELKMTADNLRVLAKLAEEGDRMAAQFFAKQEWKGKRKAGAPSKAEKEGAVKQEIAKVTDIAAHLKRIKNT